MMNRNTIKGIYIALASVMLLSGCSSQTNTNNAGITGGANGNKGQFDGITNGINGNIDGIFNEGVAVADQQSVDYNTEEYNDIKENGFKSVKANPSSTFSIDVDTASYSNLRRMILDGEKDIPDGAVRIEEMINYFDYGYEQPKEGEPFSVTREIADCPWNEDTELMLVGLHSKDLDISERPPMNVVFLIDVSGSMSNDDKLPLVQKSFSILTDNLTEKDRVSIVTYAGSDMVVLEGESGLNKEKILEAINSLEAGGSTAGADGINTAYDIAEKYFIQDGNNRIILATDGDLNVGISSESELTKLVKNKRKSGVYLSVLGFGTGNIKDNKMEALADNGNGNYSYIDSELEAKRVLIEQMSGTLYVAAKDVKINVEFNPMYIKGYRLIGYENRVMSTEDFNDDTKDAGEIGAGHSVTALYEIVPVDSKMEISIPDLKYQDDKNNGIDNGELLTINIRYKEPDKIKSELLSYTVTEKEKSDVMSARLTFASAVAEFGMLLRDSEYKGTSSYDEIKKLLNRYSLVNDTYKSEFKYLVDTMSRHQ